MAAIVWRDGRVKHIELALRQFYFHHPIIQIVYKVS